MASYSLRIKASATKEIAVIVARADRRRVVEKIEGLAREPRPRGAIKLAGYDDRYRLRMRDYRVVYLIDDGASVVMIAKLAHRKDGVC